MSLRRAADFLPEHLTLARQTCLYLLPKLADFADQITIVGGAVPSLLIGYELPPGAARHVGTVDLDLTVALELSAPDTYRRIVDRLAQVGFEQADNTRALDGTRWEYKPSAGRSAILDLLPLSPVGATTGFDEIPKLRDNLAKQLRLAFRDREKITLQGPSLTGESATADAWVCGPGAFVVIKSLTWRDRRIAKDAYDFFYVLRNYGHDVGDIVHRLAPLMGDPTARQAINVLEHYFFDENDDGPAAVAQFLLGRVDVETQADVTGYVRRLLIGCGAAPP